MIRLTDAAKLASAKLHMHKVRTALTIIVSSLIFGVIIFGATIFTGVRDSANRYSDIASNGEYLLRISPYIPNGVEPYSGSYYLSDNDIARLDELQAQYIAEQKAEAEHYGVEFDSSSAIEPYAVATDSSGKKEATVNPSSPVYQQLQAQAIQDYAKAHHVTGDDLEAFARQHGVSKIYNNNRSSMSLLSTSNTRYMKDGVDDIDNWLTTKSSSTVKDNTLLSFDTNTILDPSYTLASSNATANYMWPENDKRRELRNDDAIPVIMSSKDVASTWGKQLNIGAEPADSTGQQAWHKDVERKLNGYTYNVCYRNNAALVQLRTAVEQNNGTVKDLSSESILYNKPTNDCSPVTVKQDRRTAEQKKAEQATLDYQAKQGNDTAPVTKKLTMVIVGVKPVYANYSGSSISLQNMVASLIRPSYIYDDSTWVPQSYVTDKANSSASANLLRQVSDRLVSQSDSALNDLDRTLAFSTKEAALDFKKKYTCETRYDCDKSWMGVVEGVDYASVDMVAEQITNAAKYVVPVVLIIAVIILSITVSRTIMDSRHETAIFRAIGAKRVDMVVVYVVYTIMIALLIIVVALTLGMGGAAIVNACLSSSITSYAMSIYGIYDLPVFSLFGIDLVYIGVVVGVIVIASLLAIVLPLLRNMRRNPARDLRES